MSLASQRKDNDLGSEKKIHSSDPSDYIGGSSNISHLWEFIDYFENKLEAEIALYTNWIFSPYFKCPNFAVWIRLYTELICNKAMIELNRAEKCKRKIKSYKFALTIRDIIQIVEKEVSSKGVKKDEFERMKKAIKLTVELRHTLQHGGIPNILRDISFKNDVSEEEIKKMMNPNNFRETKKIFYDANLIIEMLPRPTILLHGDGEVEYREAKKRPNIG
jgi:hypothetical protein